MTERGQISVGPFPPDFEPGITVRIEDPASGYVGQEGVVVRKGNIGGYWVRQSDGKDVYHPWGVSRVTARMNPRQL